MSIVIGLETSSGTWIASDNRQVIDNSFEDKAGYIKSTELWPGVRLAHVGNLAQITRLKSKLPANRPGENPESTTVAVAEALTQGWTVIHDGYRFLLVVDGLLFMIDAAGAVVKAARGRPHCIGSGAEFATGFLHAIKRGPFEARMLDAIACAGAHNPYCSASGRVVFCPAPKGSR